MEELNENEGPGFFAPRCLCGDHFKFADMVELVRYLRGVVDEYAAQERIAPLDVTHARMKCQAIELLKRAETTGHELFITRDRCMCGGDTLH